TIYLNDRSTYFDFFINTYINTSYGRIETLSGFANGIFLVFISIFIMFEAIGRLIEPPKMTTDKLLLVSFLGLIVNLVGILAFNHGHIHHGHSHGHNNRGHGRKNSDHYSYDHNYNDRYSYDHVHDYYDQDYAHDVYDHD